MNKPITSHLAVLAFLLFFFYGLQAQAQQQALFQSYSAVNLSTDSPTSVAGAGSSTVTAFAFDQTHSTGAAFDSLRNAWGLETGKSGAGLNFTFTLSHPTVVQLTMQTMATAASSNQGPNNPVAISVNGISLFQQFNDVDTSLHQVAWDIPLSMIKTDGSSNSISVYLNQSATTQYYIKSATLTPRKIYASQPTSGAGTLNTTLFAQFAETSQVTGIQDAPDNSIWTRAYGLVNGTSMIPAPTFHFKPGDLVNVDIVNMLDPTHNAELQQFEELNNLSVDETLAMDHLRHEINVPHNLNNTNLHVHGLHVDPAKDDVTIVITPNGDLPDSPSYGFPYDAPNSPVPTSDGLDEGSVSDQSVKDGNWVYQYKIPDIHLPGTHWYHPHKHGSTAAQVENGLSGSIVIMEDSSNAVVPYPSKPSSTAQGAQTDYDRQAWEDKHDRVLVIQEITNYGIQLGEANGQGRVEPAGNGGKRDVTVNGKNPYNVGAGTYDQIQPGQLERWRMINAGTNHRAISHIWLGKLNTGTNKYESATTTMYMVAADGITLSEKVEVSASKPLLLAPGNRTDVLVQFDAAGSYVLFKNFPTQDTAGNDIDYDDNIKALIARTTTGTGTNQKPTAYAQNINPYIITQNGNPIENQTYKVNWAGTADTPMAPIIKVKPITDGNNDFIDVDFAYGEIQTGAAGAGKWQPYVDAGGGGSPDTSVLMNVTVSGAVTTASPKMPTDSYLSSVAPTGTMASTPSYVSPIENSDILQSRPVSFDVSGAQVQVHGASKATNQFTLNGRIFALNDPIGNPIANSVIGAGISSANEIDMSDRRNGLLTEHFELKNRVTSYTNKTSDYGLWWWTNPGYYQQIQQSDSGEYSFSAVGMPDWESVSGLTKPGVVNSNHANADNIKAIPGLPVATTGEEWILINNSGVSHPFHIHINPFFVEEVGQLSYETFAGGDKQWVMRAVTSESAAIQRTALTDTDSAPGKAGVYQADMAVDGIVGNWWDTILIPPHGYVKVRYWFNVPNQTQVGNNISVMDNFNKEGIWVYHCHILRHEDRGMMMPVITQEKVILDDTLSTQ